MSTDAFLSRFGVLLLLGSIFVAVAALARWSSGRRVDNSCRLVALHCGNCGNVLVDAIGVVVDLQTRSPLSQRFRFDCPGCGCAVVASAVPVLVKRLEAAGALVQRDGDIEDIVKRFVDWLNSDAFFRDLTS